MHPISLTSVVAGLVLLTASASAGLAQSAVIDLPRSAGPSRFVSGVGGKPVQIGVPAADEQSGQPGVINIVSAPQTTEPPDPAPTDEPQGKEPSDDQAPPDKPPGTQANSSAPDVGTACDPDCDDEVERTSE